MTCTYNVAFVMLVILNNIKVPTATTMRKLKRMSAPPSTVSKRMKGAPAVNDKHAHVMGIWVPQCIFKQQHALSYHYCIQNVALICTCTHVYMCT